MDDDTAAQTPASDLAAAELFGREVRDPEGRRIGTLELVVCSHPAGTRRAMVRTATGSIFVSLDQLFVDDGRLVRRPPSAPVPGMTRGDPPLVVRWPVLVRLPR